MDKIPTPPNRENVVGTLAARANRYGSYITHSWTKERMVDDLQHLPNWHKASPVVRQAACMIVDKLIRAFNGDPFYTDNPHDIQGYAKLWEDWIFEHITPGGEV